MQPLVSVVGLCYNQSPYIREALNSVAAQTYPNIEVILVDDASTDNSPQILKEIATKHPNWKLLLLPQNLGNTNAFNLGFGQSAGQFIIDFALDDVMLPQRIEMQVNAFLKLPATYGVVYTDSEHINLHGELLGPFYQATEGNPSVAPPSGDVFAEVLRSTFISTPTMMMKRKVLEELNGYDENLAYEDFDFWVRSARKWQYWYINKVLTQKRIVPGSMSQNFFMGNRLAFHQSTLSVCRKALGLVRNGAENQALAWRIRFQARQAAFTGHRTVVPGYKKLLQETGLFSAADGLIFGLYSLPLPLVTLFRLYHKIKGSKTVA